MYMLTVFHVLTWYLSSLYVLLMLSRDAVSCH